MRNAYPSDTGARRSRATLFAVLLMAGAGAHAGGGVYWSVNVGAPLQGFGQVGTVVSNTPYGMVAGGPQVILPAPVIVSQPRVVYAPPPVVYAPPVQYVQPGYVVRPGHGAVPRPWWGFRHHHHHHHHDRDDGRWGGGRGDDGRRWPHDR